MTTSGDSKSTAVAVQFLQRFLQDREDGVERSLADYQAMFSSAPEVVAEEFEALTNDSDPDPGGAPGGDDAAGALSHPADGARYRDAELLGRGGMGTVSRVFDPALEREVAIKRLTKGADGVPDVRRLGRFLDEAKVTGQLQHPGIVSVHEIGLDEHKTPYFTMPVIEGRSLHEIVRELHDPEAEAEWTQVRVLSVLQRVCEAMAYAHERGVVHRDLKPANVMVGRFGETYVVDWGLARAADRPDRRDIRVGHGDDGHDSALRTVEGDVIGTPAYMAPEQARGEIEGVGERSDVYAIGAMLYHVLAGTAPHVEPGTEPKSRDTLARVIAGPPTDLRRIAPATRPELVAICERAMARSPDDRYPSAAALGEDLRAFLENRVVTAYSTGPFAELGKWVARNRALAAASVLALLSLVFGLTWSEIQRSRAERNAERAANNSLLAAENLDIAFEAGRDLLGSFGLYGVWSEPGVDPIREAALERGLEYFERLRDLRGDDPRVDRQVAEARYRIATLLTELGRATAASAAWDAARVSIERVIARHGSDPELRLRLLQIEGEEHVRAMQTRARSGVEELQRIVEALADLRSEGFESSEVVRAQLGFHYNLTLAMFDARNKEGALHHSEKTLEHARELVARQGGIRVPSTISLLGSSTTLRGKLMWQTGQPERAAAYYEESIELLENGLVAAPGHRGLRSRLGEALNLQAILQSQTGQRAAALATLERAIEVYTELTAAFPGARDYHGAFGGVLCNRGIFHSQDGELEKAIERLEAAVLQIRRALAIDAGASDYRDYRRIAGKELALAFAKADRHADAARSIEEWFADVPETPPFDGARMWAVCAKVALADAGLSASERAATLAAYGDESVALLRRAAAADRVPAERLRAAPFDALADHAGFRAFVAELGR